MDIPVNRRIPFGRIRNTSPPVDVWSVRRMRRVERNLGCGARRVVGRAVVFADGTDRDHRHGRRAGWRGRRWSRPVALQKSARTSPLCDVSRPSVTCPFGMVLSAVVAVAQQVCHDRRGYVGDEVPQRGVACSEHADAQSARMVCVSRCFPGRWPGKSHGVAAMPPPVRRFGPVV